MATNKEKSGHDYDASSIKHLSSRDAVRAKPAMYIGPTDGSGIFTIIREVLDNAKDENLAGHGTHTEFYVDDDSSYWVTDNGRGMPVGDMEVTDSVSGKKYKMPALQAITSLLHAGGKLDQGNTAYKISAGSHGVGQKATNFLSDEFDVWTFSKMSKKDDPRWFHIGFKKGVMTDPMKVCKAPDHPFLNHKVKRGSVVRIKPDLSIFTEKKFPLAMVNEWAQIASYFSNKLRITFAHHNGKQRDYYAEDGPSAYVVDKIAKLKCQVLSPVVFSFCNELVDCVFQFTAHDACEVQAFTNGLNNADKGFHFASMFGALLQSLEPYAKKKQEFTVAELREGLVGLINVKLSAPQFSSQTKEKLSDPRAGKPLQDMLLAEFTKFFAKHKSLAALVCERAYSLKMLKSQFTASKQVLNKLKHVTRIGFPAKAAISPNCKPEDRELYLLEGESAASLARSALFSGFQELLPLKGKPPNPAKKSEEMVLLNQEIVYILAMIGFNPTAVDPLAKLRVGKIIFLADPDADGEHINCLLLALKVKYLPSLIERGMVYIADTPEFFSETKSGFVFGDSVADMRAKNSKAGSPSARINHVKGYGEFELKPLRDLVFAPETRRLIQLQPMTTKDKKTFETIMGESVEGRKLLLGV